MRMPGFLYEGEFHTVSYWAKKYNIPYDVLCKRLDRDWPIYRALHKEVRKYEKHQDI